MGATMHDVRPRTLAAAVLRTVAYGDVFDAPLRMAELQRYVELPAAAGDVRRAVAGLAPGRLAVEEDLVALAGREALFGLRRRRQAVARRLWPPAVRWGRRIGRGPWVRMVAVTGALAMDNVDDGADVDYLILVEPGRVWLARWWIVQQVRLARLADRVVLCPNWVLASDALELDHRDVFAARELTQMVPVSGAGLYRSMRRANGWATALLPNADGPPRPPAGDGRRAGRGARLAERLLGGRSGSRLEAWERRRKTREIAAGGAFNPEVTLDERQCKGHVDGHGRRTAAEWRARLAALPDQP